jgi:hypothetical protein
MTSGTAEQSCQRSGRRGRALHLLDIENLVGDPCADDLSVSAAVDAYRLLADVGPEDLAVVATNGRLALASGLAWPGALLRVGRGPNGADLALLAEATPTDVALRFSRVVVGSGDGIFAETARELRRLGCEVVVVARPGSIARRLRRFADVRLLEVEAARGYRAAKLPTARVREAA